MQRDSLTERVAEVEAKSASFRRELGLLTLVLTQVMYIVGSGWVGTAAKLGPAHVAFWALAILFYYLPQAAVVIYLNRLMPIEGGLYQWASVGLGDFLGFLTAWNLWAYTVVIISVFGVIIATNLSYLLVHIGATFTGAAWYTPLVSATAVVALTLVSLFGLRVGKWLQGLGGLAHLLTFGALILVPLVAAERGGDYRPLAAAMPSVTLLSLNIFGKLALGALSGFEYVAILAGECRQPERTIGRSVIAAAPIIAVMFILGTSSVLALVPLERIDLISPIPQTLSVGFSGLALARFVVPALIALLLVRQIGTVTLLFAGNTRLPMVAGWDRLVPRWFTRLHPRYRTPQNSILFVGALTLALTLAGQVGVGLQEAFQLLENAAGILYAFTYLALFAIPLFGAARLGVRPPLWLRAAAACGFGVAALYSVLSIFPIIEVASWSAFAAKILAVLVATEVAGIAIYRAGRR
ncbi:MAG TPA: APC family permease [Candidatus Polarisedimenticolaceae bacterium]|nr:APC family permease [Candidatus Polarisedimenticolaceae bacterium]